MCREAYSMWMEGMNAEASGNLEAAIERYTASLQGLGSAGEDVVPSAQLRCCLISCLRSRRDVF